MLKCQKCGRTLDGSHMNKIGLQCGLNGCTGVFEFAGGYIVYGKKGAKLDLRCTTCMHICSSAVTKLKPMDRCPMKGCNGRLDRFFGG
jgi:hypothetical protein